MLSEVGMLPAELMGLNPSKFRQLNNLIKNKKFINSLIANVNSIVSLSNSGKSNSIILNYEVLNWEIFLNGINNLLEKV